MTDFPLNLIPHLDSLLPVLEKYAGTNPHDFALTFDKKYSSVNAADAAHLLDCYQRAKQKYPCIHKPGMLYTRTAIEQSTGEALLRFKSGRFTGKTAADLTGGLGMDTLFLSTNFEEVLYLECNRTLAETAAHNHSLLNVSNIRHITRDAIDWLRGYSGPIFDLVYIDPSRRNERQRVFLLKDCEPDILRIYPDLKRISKKLLIKLSPLYDITRLQLELPDASDIYVISAAGEVKEILAEINSESHPNHKNCRIHAVLLDKLGHVQTELKYRRNHQPDYQIADKPGRFLYEPDPAIIKAGLSTFYAEKANLSMLNYGTDYMTGDTDITDYPGKRFRIMQTLPYKPRVVKKYLQEQNLTGVHIHKRDFPLQPEQLFKKFGLKMGEQGHLFFTKNADGELILIATQSQ